MSILSFDIGIRNLAFCEIDSKLIISDWQVISLRDMGEKINFDETIDRLLTFLRKTWPERNGVVLIENQPCMVNPTMKSIQVCIYTYFRMIGGHPQLCSASNKLKVSKNVTEKKKLTYGEKKKLAIATTRLYIKETQWEQFFDKQPKKDDYSDSFLQAVNYFESAFFPI